MNISIFKADLSNELFLSYASNTVSAGFPSPAMDFEDLKIDLNSELIKHPMSTYFGRVRGVSMKNAGIDDGDLLIIDKSLDPIHGRVAVCFLDGEFTAKRIIIKNKTVYLKPENEDYNIIKISSDNEFVVWGIVTHVIKSL